MKKNTYNIHNYRLHLRLPGYGETGGPKENGFLLNVYKMITVCLYKCLKLNSLYQRCVFIRRNIGVLRKAL